MTSLARRKICEKHVGRRDERVYLRIEAFSLLAHHTTSRTSMLVSDERVLCETMAAVDPHRPLLAQVGTGS